MMDGTHGTPWIMYPIILHSPREYECTLNTTEQCNYYQGYWRFWYEADHRYALPTVAFFLAVIAVFTIAHCLPRSLINRRLLTATRYLSYKSLRIDKLNWTSAPLGILLLLSVGIIYFASMTLGPRPYYWASEAWGYSPPLANRSGWLSLACLPFVFATAGKSNFITLVTGISHEKLQIFHRWSSYAMFVTALLHSFPFIVNDIHQHQIREQWTMYLMYWTGVVALLAQAWLTFASLTPLRNLCYEWFKFTHFVAALVFVLFFFFHTSFTLTSADYFIAVGVLFSLSWLHRQLRIYFQHGLNLKATMSLAPNGSVKVTIPIHSDWQPGQHFFVRFLSLGILQAGSIHPFTACSLPSRQSCNGKETNEVVFYIRPKGGFTARLAKYAATHPESQTRVLLDGPYGGISAAKLTSFDRLVVIAGGSGAGFMLPLLEGHLRHCDTLGLGPKTPSMRLVLAARDVQTAQWFQDEVDSHLCSMGLTFAQARLEVQLHVTSTEQNLATLTSDNSKTSSTVVDVEKHTDHASSSSLTASSQSREDTMHYEHGRPNLATLLQDEMAAMSAGSSLGIFVCGPMSMQTDVSNATAVAQLSILRSGDNKDVYLHREHFGWS